MRTGRKWTYFTAGIAALLFGLDAAAERPTLRLPTIPDWNKTHAAFPGKGNGSSALTDPPGRGGNMPDGSNKAGKHKDKDDTPGENAQAVAEAGASSTQQLHRVPTCR